MQDIVCKLGSARKQHALEERCPYIHTYTYIYIHINTHIHAYIHTYIHTYMHAGLKDMAISNINSNVVASLNEMKTKTK